jgi:hypothetical protein
LTGTIGDARIKRLADDLTERMDADIAWLSATGLRLRKRRMAPR